MTHHLWPAERHHHATTTPPRQVSLAKPTNMETLWTPPRQVSLAKPTNMETLWQQKECRKGAPLLRRGLEPRTSASLCEDRMNDLCTWVEQNLAQYKYEALTN